MATAKQRREAERRRLQRQMQRRREQAARRKRLNVILSVVGVLVVAAVVITLISVTGGDDTPAASDPSASPSTSAPASTSSSTSAPTSTPASSAAPFGTCTWTKSGTAARQVTAPSTTKPSTKGTVDVAVTTNRGNLTFTLNRAKAPCAVASFVSLAKQKYFDGTPCHRLTASTSLSVLQCGDPTGTGSGGPGYSFGDELSGSEKYTRGVLAMANSGANTNGSQFFIVYKNSQLPASYTVFGTVSKGLGVVDAIAKKGVQGGGQDGKPAESVTLTKVQQAA